MAADRCRSVRYPGFADRLAAVREAVRTGSLEGSVAIEDVVMLEVATAARQDGVNRHDSDRLDDAFRLARDALDLGVTYSSTRVVERARRFRRDNPSPPTACVREFDDRLRAALA